MTKHKQTTSLATGMAAVATCYYCATTCWAAQQQPPPPPPLPPPPPPHEEEDSAEDDADDDRSSAAAAAVAAAHAMIDKAAAAELGPTYTVAQNESRAPRRQRPQQQPQRHVQQQRLCAVNAVRTFNPWVEASVASGTATTNPPARVQRLQDDLASLPLWLEPRIQDNHNVTELNCPGRNTAEEQQRDKDSSKGGVVLLREGTGPSADFLQYLRGLHIGVPTPQYVHYKRLGSRDKITLPVGTCALPLLPWGWSPQTRALYGRLDTDQEVWYTGDDTQRRLFGKVSATELLRKVLTRNLQAANPCSCLPRTQAEMEYQCGHVCNTLEEVYTAISALRNGYACASGSVCGVVIKDSFEGSGRGFVHVKQWALQGSGTAATEMMLRPEQLGKVRKILARNPVVVERWLQLHAEISAHYFVADDKESGDIEVVFRGCQRFSSNKCGKWIGSHSRDPCRDMSPAARAELFASAVPCCAGNTPLPRLNPQVEVAFEAVREALMERLKGSGYRGPVGVDAILYETEDAAVQATSSTRLMLKPISEINLRENMGTLAVHLSQYVHPEQAGFYTILNAELLKQELHTNDDSKISKQGSIETFDMLSYSISLKEQHPLTFALAADGMPQITSGVLFLTEPRRDCHFVGVLAVGRDVEGARFKCLCV
jgi:hypothetical protein